MSEKYIYDNNREETNAMEGERNVIGRKLKTKNGKAYRMVKKAGAIVLSAALFGGVAAGSFQTVSRISGQTATEEGTSQEGRKQSLLRAVAASTANKGSMDVTDIVKAAMPSIVAITSKSVQEVEDYFGMFGRNMQIPQQEVESCGSGIIIGKNESELLVATNNHVVEAADTISVCFVDDQVYEGVVKGTDTAKDLAVVAVPLDQISEETMSAIAVAAIGDSGKMEVGEQVVAIGNALGYGQSVTTGIVSATNRTLDESETEGASYDGISLIQTDAAINPGNSGGALLNMDGQVIGINSAKLASTEVEGMGYAISINDAYETIENLMNEKTRTKTAEGEKASIGIAGVGVSQEAQEAYGIPAGVFVAEVTEGGAAKAAQMEVNSVITAFDGKAVSDIQELKNILEYYEAGEEVELTVQVPSDNGYTEQRVTVTLGRAEEDSRENGNEEEWPGYFGDFSDSQDDPV